MIRLLKRLLSRKPTADFSITKQLSLDSLLRAEITTFSSAMQALGKQMDWDVEVCDKVDFFRVCTFEPMDFNLKDQIDSFFDRTLELLDHPSVTSSAWTHEPLARMDWRSFMMDSALFPS